MTPSDPMDEARQAFVDGMGTASATSGVLSQIQGRIFGFLYLREDPASLDDIAQGLQQSKSNISVNIRGLLEWHLVRRVSVPSSRKDHYEAVADLWRVTREIMERRFRWNIRQVLAACDEARRLASDAGPIADRLDALRSFAASVDAGIEAFGRGEPMAPPPLQRIETERDR